MCAASRSCRRSKSCPGTQSRSGALTTLSTIEDSGFIQRNYPALHEAVKTVASPILRNMGTLGGNICLDTRCLWLQPVAAVAALVRLLYQEGWRPVATSRREERNAGRRFSGDTPPALLCLNAEIEIVGPKGFRRVPLKELLYKRRVVRMKLEKNEMLTRVFLPETMSGWQGAYLKLRIRGSIDYPLAGVAVAIKKNGVVQDAQAAITGVKSGAALDSERCRCVCAVRR